MFFIKILSKIITVIIVNIITILFIININIMNSNKKDKDINDINDIKFIEEVNMHIPGMYFVFYLCVDIIYCFGVIDLSIYIRIVAIISCFYWLFTNLKRNKAEKINLIEEEDVKIDILMSCYLMPNETEDNPNILGTINIFAEKERKVFSTAIKYGNDKNESLDDVYKAFLLIKPFIKKDCTYIVDNKEYKDFKYAFKNMVINANSNKEILNKYKYIFEEIYKSLDI